MLQEKKKNGARGWSRPRSQASPWEDHQVWVLGFVQERIQEPTIVKWRQVYSGRHILHRQSLGRLGKQEGWLIFIGWVISGRIIPAILGEGAGLSRNWATTHFLPFYGWPQNCHGACGCVIHLADVLQWVYNEAQGLVEVSHLPSWT